MKSLMFQPGAVFDEPPECKPCRTEVFVNVMKNGRIYRYVLRDKITPEDPYLVMIKAAAFAIREGEPYMAQPPSRSVKDFLVKSSVVI